MFLRLQWLPAEIQRFCLWGFSRADMDNYNTRFRPPDAVRVSLRGCVVCESVNMLMLHYAPKSSTIEEYTHKPALMGVQGSRFSRAYIPSWHERPLFAVCTKKVSAVPTRFSCVFLTRHEL